MSHNPFDDITSLMTNLNLTPIPTTTNVDSLTDSLNCLQITPLPPIPPHLFSKYEQYLRAQGLDVLHAPLPTDLPLLELCTLVTYEIVRQTRQHTLDAYLPPLPPITHAWFPFWLPLRGNPEAGHPSDTSRPQPLLTGAVREMDEAQAAIWKGFQRFGMYYQADMPVDDFELFEKAVAWIFEEVERDGGEVQAVPVGIVEDARRMREDG